jgi:Fe2+ transport system protein FeoA
MSTAQVQDVPFTDLQAGDRARLVADTLRVDDRDTLAALGLTRTSPFRVARAGDPWIVHVRATRIGLSAAVARCLRVVPI